MNQSMSFCVKVVCVLSLLGGFFSRASIVEAIEIPNFPTCSNVSGTIRSSYPSGTHGIAGNPGIFQGSDTVYTLSSEMQLQCFCSIDGNGIQTNWWKVSSISQDQIEELKKQGWVFVGNGADWGLEQGPYLAKNQDYSCKSSGNTGGSSTTNNGTGGITLGTSAENNPQVLGLAATGTSKALVVSTIIFMISCVGAIIARRRNA